MTITEALAEIKTVSKRIQSKREFINSYLFRPDSMKDPLDKDGGSAVVLQREMQAVSDLEQRLVDLRRGIQKANDATDVTLNGVTKTISDWLVWRREIASGRGRFHEGMVSKIHNARQFTGRTFNDQNKQMEIVVNVDEKAIGSELENLKKILGDLDGQLSLKNATVMVEV